MRSPLERHRQHRQARGLVALGLVASVAYLAARAAMTLSGVPVVLSAPALAIEVAGAFAAGLLAWALWPAPGSSSTDLDVPASRFDREVPPADVVVSVESQSVNQVRATLAAVRSVAGAGSVVLADASADGEHVALAEEMGVGYVRDAVRGGAAPLAALESSTTPYVLFLEAGDIPSSDILERLSGSTAPDVAIVQGLGVDGDAADIAAHATVPDLAFERSSLNPALGRRGLAFWLGSGSLVRVSALRASAPAEASSPLEARWIASAALHAAGWRITAPDELAVVAHRRLTPDGAVHRDRRDRALGGLRLLLGSLRTPAPRRLARAAACAAWAVRPVSGIRKAALIVVVAASLLLGVAPLRLDSPALAVLWLPAALYTALGLSMLSDNQLRLGDRTRYALHSMGPALGALLRRRPSALAATQHGATLVGATVLLGCGLVTRALVERLASPEVALTALRTMPHAELVLMVTLAVTLMAGAVEVFRGVSVRAQSRRSTRVGTELAATVDGWAVHVVDLTAEGAGVLTLLPVEVGGRVRVEADLPTSSGITRASTLAVVRSLQQMEYGEWRLGLEFEQWSPGTLEALAEFCTVEPMRSVLGETTETTGHVTDQVVYVSMPSESTGPGAAVEVVRVVSAAAAVAAIVTILPAGTASLVDALSGAASAPSLSMMVMLASGFALHVWSRSRTIVGHGH
ncbi:MAG: hypothetical protein ACO3AV_03315 [Ilumatobacteraceae bacterium]